MNAEALLRWMIDATLAASIATAMVLALRQLSTEKPLTIKIYISNLLKIFSFVLLFIGGL